MKIVEYCELEPFGVKPLTGEACVFGMRLLCDLNEAGLDLIQRFFGGNVDVKYASNWNTTVNLENAVGSVLLTYTVLADLAAFALLTPEYPFVLVHQNGVVVGYSSDEWAQLPRDSQGCLLLNYKRTYHQTNPQPGVTTGDRNNHQMSGRAT